MTEIRRITESQSAHGRVKVNEKGEMLELKLWNAEAKSGATLLFSDLYQLRKVMDDWKLLIEEAERLTSVYGKT